MCVIMAGFELCPLYHVRLDELCSHVFFFDSGCHALCRYIQEEAELRFVGHNLKNDAEVSFATDPSDCKKPEVCALLSITMARQVFENGSRPRSCRVAYLCANYKILGRRKYVSIYEYVISLHSYISSCRRPHRSRFNACRRI